MPEMEEGFYWVSLGGGRGGGRETIAEFSFTARNGAPAWLIPGDELRWSPYAITVLSPRIRQFEPVIKSSFLYR